MKDKINNALRQVYENLHSSGSDDVDMIPPDQDEHWYPLQTLLNDHDLCASDFLINANWHNDDEKGLIFILYEQNIPLNIWEKIFRNFPAIQPLANGYSATHPLVVAASKDWSSFRKYLNDGTFKPKQFADIIRPISGINSAYANITKDVENYQNDVLCGDYFSVFEILYLCNQDDLLERAQKLALHYPVNVFAYIDHTYVFKLNDGIHSHSVVLQLKEVDYNNQRFNKLYVVPKDDFDNYNESVFNKKLKEYFKYNDEDGIIDDIQIDTNDISNDKNFIDDHSFSIEVYAGTKTNCDRVEEYLNQHIEREKKWLNYGFDGIKEQLKLKPSLFHEAPDSINDIITEYLLPKP